MAKIITKSVKLAIFGEWYCHPLTNRHTFASFLLGAYRQKVRTSFDNSPLYIQCITNLDIPAW